MKILLNFFEIRRVFLNGKDMMYLFLLLKIVFTLIVYVIFCYYFPNTLRYEDCFFVITLYVIGSQIGNPNFDYFYKEIFVMLIF